MSKNAIPPHLNPELPKHTFPVHFDRPSMLEPKQTYRIQHVVYPTEVINHYSGWPITRLGAEVWTSYGAVIPASTDLHDLQFSEPQEGRSSFHEGQMPYFFIWKMKSLSESCSA